MINKILNDGLKAVLLVGLLAVAGQVLADTDSSQIENLIKQGQLKQALALTQDQLAHDSDNVNYLFLKGLILTKQNKLDAAKKIFVRLTTEHPELPEPFNNLAVIDAAQGDFTAAREALQKAIDTHPSYATAHENLGDLYAKMASKAYNEALELDQANTSAKEKLLLVNNLFSAQDKQKLKEQDRQEQQKEEDLDRLKAELKKTSEQAAQEQDKANRLKQQVSDLQAQQAAAEKRAQQARGALASLNQQTSQAAARSRQEQQKATAQLNAIQAQIEAKKKELNQVVQKRDRIVQQADAERQQAQAQTGQAQAAADRAKRQLADLKQKEKALTASLEQQTADAQVQLDQAREKLKQIQADIAKRERERQKFIAQADQERKQTLAQIDNDRTELEKVGRELKRLRGERQAIEKQNRLELAKLNEAATEKPATKRAAQVSHTSEHEVIKAVKAWAASWSAKDVKGYLSAYADDFKPDDGMSRSEWRSERRKRIRKPRFIRVSLDNIRVKFIGDRQARVVFRQSYKSNSYHDRVEKTLLLENRNGHWLITAEESK